MIPMATQWCVEDALVNDRSNATQAAYQRDSLSGEKCIDVESQISPAAFHPKLQRG